MRPVTVVLIRSLSYTGTTWINALLGCHARALAIGPPNRAYECYRDGWDDLCRIHGPACTLWPALHETFDPDGNLYLQLADHTGKDVIVINNPYPANKSSRDLEHPDVLVRKVRIVRDGRAVCNSYTRHHPESDFLEAVCDWFLPAAEPFPFDEQDPDVLCLRYEDVVRDPAGAMARAGTFLDLQYSDRFHRYWEFDHHFAAANPGLCATIRRLQTGRPLSGENGDFYEGLCARLEAAPEQPVLDERWTRELSDRERFVFDYYAGDVNERWGYERDRFTTGQVRQFTSELQARPRDSRPPLTARLGRRRDRLGRLVRTLADDLPISPRRTKQLALLLAAVYVLSVAAAALAGWLLAR